MARCQRHNLGAPAAEVSVGVDDEPAGLQTGRGRQKAALISPLVVAFKTASCFPFAFAASCAYLIFFRAKRPDRQGRPGNPPMPAVLLRLQAPKPLVGRPDAALRPKSRSHPGSAESGPVSFKGQSFVGLSLTSAFGLAKKPPARHP